MFRLHKTVDVITLFHRPSLPTSTRILNLLKNASAQAAEGTTEEQRGKKRHPPFELNVTEAPPTTDQLRSILEYVGSHKSMELVDGAKDEADAIKKLSENPRRFKHPVAVDWNNGRAVVGDNESAIISMLSQRPAN